MPKLIRVLKSPHSARRIVFAGAALLLPFALLSIAMPTSELLFSPVSDLYAHVGIGLAALACFVHAVNCESDRRAWLAIGGAITSVLVGSVYWSIGYAGSFDFPLVSLSDLLYLSFYPPIFYGVCSILRRRMTDLPKHLWLHGVVAGLTIAAIDAALVAGPISGLMGGSDFETGVALFYSLADLALLAIVVWAASVAGPRLGSGFVWLATGVGVLVVADTNYLLGFATGGYETGHWIDPLWPAGMLLIAFASTTTDPQPRTIAFDRNWLLVPGSVCALIAIAIVGVDQFTDVHPAAMMLTLAAGLVIVIQMIVSFRENLDLIEERRAQAVTDPVTGLPNNRALQIDLERACEDVASDPTVLMIFDLNGFKRYNDRFGHLAGDVMLRRLGEKLVTVMKGVGRAYRLGGDEFCVIARVPKQMATVMSDMAASVLSESGEEFEISAAHGSVIVPTETADPQEALRIADQRMYALKYGDAPPSDRGAAGVIQMLKVAGQDAEASADEAHLLIRETAMALGLGRQRADETARAYELRNIGNVAIPERVLSDHGRLSESEAALVRTHPVVGERLLSMVKSMQPIAEMVRHHHERFDGAGYPDGLAAEAIPIGSRIVSVAAAYIKMTSPQPYRAPMDERSALARLRAGAGSKYDHRVVAAFSEAVELRMVAGRREVGRPRGNLRPVAPGHAIL